MTASSVELEQLKRRLVAQYETQISAHVGTAPSSAVPSYMYQQLLCLRAGRPVGAAAELTSTADRVQLLAENQPPAAVMLLQRMHKAQEESVRLLAVRAAPADGSATGQATVRPFSAEDRMALLSRLAEAGASTHSSPPEVDAAAAAPATPERAEASAVQDEHDDDDDDATAAATSEALASDAGASPTNEEPHSAAEVPEAGSDCGREEQPCIETSVSATSPPHSPQSPNAACV
ncbi:hypothetical protein NESM_000517000 [Novymonas esmeraldas]|uniref:Uncharacterized protein n=1 Tax=Novymonas esmeraldas TaxID=1808958 RepID=A0AAW0EQC8_9TRYP